MFKLATDVPVLQTIGAYTALDCVGAELLFVLDSPRGVIKRLTIVDNDSESAQLILYLFDAQVTAPARTDADAFAPADADLAKLIMAIPIAVADYVDVAAVSAATVTLDRAFVLAAGATTLYGSLVCVGTPTYTAATDLTVKLLVETR